MSLLVIGSVGFDAIKTPHGKTGRILGGAATYFAVAASFFTAVRIVAVVGDDFTDKEEEVLRARGVDNSGIVHEKGKSFFWMGEYGNGANNVKTLDTQFGVSAKFNPQIPEQFKDTRYLFLANANPTWQLNVHRQLKGSTFVAGATMNYWINDSPGQVYAMLRDVHILLTNDTEARILAQDPSLSRAAEKILKMGPQALLVMHGEYGTTAFFQKGAFGIELHPFHAPTLPIETVTDATGARSSFAGGFMGYIAAQDSLTPNVFKRAMFFGGVMASFAAEGFGLERLHQLRAEEIDERYKVFSELILIE